MKELYKKVFNTIFILLSSFIIIVLIIYNITIYKKEYDNVKRNLLIFNEMKISKNIKEPNNTIINLKDRKIDNMLIMNYEIYSIKLNKNRVEKIINHGDNSNDFDIQNIVNLIMKRKKGLNIGNLYSNKYSYNYKEDNIVIMNNKKVNERLSLVLMKSIVLLIGFEIIIYYLSKKITDRITKPAQESFDRQKDFITDASHELKTPLAIIIASSDELISDNKNKKYIENIKYESERMNKLIKSLLDLSKLENKVSINQYKEENLSLIVEKVCLMFEAIAFEENIKIKTSIFKDIIFNCSKEEIEKLMSIILDNAIKHSYKKSTININVNEDKNNIKIDIINSGDPIKKEEEEKIFERFYRKDKSRNRDANRYGLGLAIAKKIVLNHNGIIKAFSKNNKTTFRIVFKK